MGSLSGAECLGDSSLGIQKSAQPGQKPGVEHKGKSWLDVSLQYGDMTRKSGLKISNFSFE